MVPVASHLFRRCLVTATGDHSVCGELVVRDRFGDRDVAVHEHAELVAQVEIAGVECFDVETDHVEAGFTCREDLRFDRPIAAFGIKRVGAKALNERTADRRPLSVHLETRLGQLNSSKPESGPTSMRYRAADLGYNVGPMQRRAVKRPAIIIYCTDRESD